MLKNSKGFRIEGGGNGKRDKISFYFMPFLNDFFREFPKKNLGLFPDAAKLFYFDLSGLIFTCVKETQE